MQKGFGLIGVLISLVIIMTLLAILLPRYTRTVQTQHQQQQGVLQQVQQLQKQLNSQQQLRQQQWTQLENTPAGRVPSAKRQPGKPPKTVK